MDLRNLEWLIKFDAQTWSVKQLEEDGYKVLGVDDKWITCTIE